MMDELHKAAILLNHLKEQERAQILAQLDSDRRTQLENLVKTVPDVSQQELAEIVAEYQSWIERLSPPAHGEQTGSREVSSTGFRPPFVSLDPQRLAEHLHREPETVVCAVMCCVPESVARDFFESLPSDRRADVVARLPAQRELQPIVKQEIGEFLSESQRSETGADQPGAKLLSRLTEPSAATF